MSYVLDSYNLLLGSFFVLLPVPDLNFIRPLEDA